MDILRRGSKGQGDEGGSVGSPCSSSKIPLPSVYQAVLEEMAAKRFDTIRFPAYRAASKLRFIQKKTNMQHVDIYNVIEAIRENGLHAYQDQVLAEISLPRLDTLVKSIYYQLSKRLPPSQRVNFEHSALLLYTFLCLTLDPQNRGFVSVFSVKLTLSALASGTMEEKLTYLFSLMSEPKNGSLIPDRFKIFIRDLLSLARGVFENNPYFTYNDAIPFAIVPFDHVIKLKEFMEIVINPKAPPLVFAFFMAYSRMSDVEQVIHPVTCESCHRDSFTGFRYKCQKCYNFHLCQECFWRGRTSGTHDPNTHPCREFSFWQSQSQSLRRSFRCLPSQRKPKIQIKEDIIDQRNKIDLKHIVPPSPVAGHRQMNFNYGNKVAPSASPFTRGSLAYGSMPNMRSSSKSNIRNIPPVNPVLLNNPLIHPPEGDAEDEHQLVAEYTRKLSFSSIASPSTSRRLPLSVTQISDPEILEKQRLVSQLEARNREMMREIERLKQGVITPEDYNRSIPSSSTALEPLYASELKALRRKKEELEKHLSALHDSRKELLLQLESLMKLLKNSQAGILISNPSSAASTLSRSQSQRGPSRQADGERTSQSFRIQGAQATTPDTVKKAVKSLVKELNSEDEAAIDEMGLSLSKQLAIRSSSKPPPVPRHQTAISSSSKSQMQSSQYYQISNGKSSNTNKKQQDESDFDEDELDLQMLQKQMVVMRKSSQDVLPNGTSRSGFSRASLQSNDDDTDIYPETDDEFYSSSWINKRPVINGH